MRQLVHVYMALFLLIAVPLTAADLSGNYQASGTNPGGKGSYTGTVQIAKNGDSYRIAWDVGTRYVGTGIVTGEYFSVAYADTGGKWFGVVVCKIMQDGKRLEGEWCGHNGPLLGKETLTRITE